MRTLLRSWYDYRDFWPLWLPLLVIAVILPLNGIAMPLVERQLIDQVLLPKRLDLLPRTMAIFGGLWLVSTVCQILSSGLGTYLGQRMTLRLYQRLFVHSENLSLAFSHRQHSGRTMALFSNDAPAVNGLFTGTLFGGFSSMIALIIGIAVMLKLSVPLAIAAGLIPPLVGGIAFIVTRPLKKMSERMREKAADLSQGFIENLNGMREVVAFGQERAQESRFVCALRELQRLSLRMTVFGWGIGTAQSLFSLTVTLVILGYGGYLVIHGQATLGTVAAMRALFGTVLAPAGAMWGLVSSTQLTLVAAERVYKFLDEKPRVEEDPDAFEPEELLGDVKGTVTFEGVSFAYTPERPVLHDISFHAQPGEMVALVGPSGAGKSTLASLLARFYDPTAGRVLLDGEDLRDFTLAGLRRHIGIVFQDTFLFATSIGENIRFGREGATDAEIEAAARAAHAWEFIEQLPQGLQTPVGERGVQLSEGQKQRIAIARALLRNPRLLILDEPTSALDARSEHLLQAALDTLMRGRTTFVIAHRLATVLQADRILVLEGGRLVEHGTHQELLRRGGLYRELYDLQFGDLSRHGEMVQRARVEPAAALAV